MRVNFQWNKILIFQIGLLGLFFILGVLSVQDLSTTYDEMIHYDYGIFMLHGNTERTGTLGDSNMPFLVFNAFPKRIAELFLPEGSLKSFLMEFNTARYVTIAFSLLVAMLVFHWSRSLYGTVPAFASLLLYIFDPNIIAHSQLVSTDIYAAGVTTLVFYCTWRFARNRSLMNGVMWFFALGISQLAKYSTIVLFPLAILSIFIYDLSFSDLSFDAMKKIKHLFVRYLGYFVVGVSVITLFINIGFFFNHTFTPFGKYEFRSDWFTDLKTNYPVLHSVRVPFPYPYLDGLDWMRDTEQGGKNSGPVYLLGKLSKPGFPGYYFIASFFKVPIATQIIIWSAIVIYIMRPDRRRKFFQDEIFFFAPVIFFSLYLNFFFKTQIGIRYYLIMFPALYIFCGSLFSNWEKFRLVQKTVSFALFASLIISVFSYYPNYLTYFNELVWNRNQSYKYLADSNLDWGQSSAATAQYLQNHPDAVYGPQEAQAGHLVVGVNHLVGVTEDPAKYAWLRENFEPVETINNNILIYKISPEEIALLCSTTQYCK